ncbi:ATP-NAD kinase family protein [Halarsenatibacter silvermanii]|uniref:Predicted polyphosphate-or ATP-dependent NAD kinase n=1 Tax=Halarsenatibacter silvermanii TaxID=321763 RepID=A0A1G9IST9_9FIRM|nr:ATP-NAD kinase family protein [Halarsenatibacter silvermanii]SDL28162.1 Predicted polyphosphate-or ATP-dependent NAD kinase [Halarsenatibacter silvermanii]
MELITYPAEMGEKSTARVGISAEVIGEIDSGETRPEDTRQAARDMKEKGVELILFAGGDGTARDIYSAVETSLPALGIPAGVKIHSAVFATNPKNAGVLVRKFVRGEVSGTDEKEVMDIDEDAFREGEVRARLFGYLSVPGDQQLTQNQKSGSGKSDESTRYAIAGFFLQERMKEDTLYIIGPGTTTSSIMEKLELNFSLLGVDAIFNEELVGSDLAEEDLLNLLTEYENYPAEIVVTVIGGQGFIFGRGNQQISDRVIRRVGEDSITIIATSHKLYSLPENKMLIDTGDQKLNEQLSGYYRVITDYKTESMIKAGT